MSAVDEFGFSSVSRNCVVELVGLELTTKVLWNMVGVRPTPLVGHLSRFAGSFAVLLDFPGFLILDPPQSVMEHGSSPTNYPGRTPRTNTKCYGIWGVRPAPTRRTPVLALKAR